MSTTSGLNKSIKIGKIYKYLIIIIQMNQIQSLKIHCEFNNPYDCYVLLAVSRKKDTPEITNSQEIVFREVIKSEKDIAKKYLKVKTMCQTYQDEEGKKYPFYIYVSLNARDSLKATFELMKKINLWTEEALRGVDRSQFFKKVYGHFYSTLMYRTCKSKHTKYFMFDLDDKSIIENVLEEIGENVVMVKETRNGYHIKTKAFDTRSIMELFKDSELEIKRDGQLFVEYIK